MRRAGFVTIIALVLVGLAATTLAVMAVAARAEFRRTESTVVDAQLRQLLAVGAEDVKGHARQWGQAIPRQNWLIALPKELAVDGAALSVISGGDGEAAMKVQVTAVLAGRSAGQVLRLGRIGDRWRIADCELMDVK